MSFSLLELSPVVAPIPPLTQTLSLASKVKYIFKRTHQTKCSEHFGIYDACFYVPHLMFSKNSVNKEKVFFLKKYSYNHLFFFIKLESKRISDFQNVMLNDKTAAC